MAHAMKRSRPLEQDDTLNANGQRRVRAKRISKTDSVTNAQSDTLDAGRDSNGSVTTDQDTTEASSFELDEPTHAAISQTVSTDDSDGSIEPVSRSAPKSRTKARSIPDNRPNAVNDGTELWRQGVTLSTEPGTEVIIKRPKARAPGRTPYKDDTVHPNTLLFLNDLKANNDREWLKMHDPDYRQSLKDFNTLLEVVTEKLIMVDETIPELPVKDITFRIYRDIRFSPDPTPYKPYFSAAWSRTGRKGPYAHYYLQIQPGHNFIGGGCWYPESRFLAAIRRNIDQHPDQLRRVLSDKAMRSEFLNKASSKDEDMISAFCTSKSNAESALKTKPKGYGGDHKDILLLRLKSFVIGRRLTDEEVTSPDFLKRLTALLEIMKPYITYLNRVIMPDPDIASDDDDDDPEESDLVLNDG